MTTPHPRIALVTLHDVTPAHGDRIFMAIDHLRGLGVQALNLLVVPDFHHQGHLAQDAEFCRRLLKVLGPRDEVALHGFWHLADQAPRSAGKKAVASIMTAGEGEFQDLSYEHARTRIEDALGMRPRGFVAPAWLDNAETARAVRDAGLDWCEDHLRVHDLARDRAIFAPVLSLASRSFGRRWGSVAFAEIASRTLTAGRVVRLAAHPNDYLYGRLVDTLGRVVERWLTTHTALSYREALACISES
jgi:predicted deacetylase